MITKILVASSDTNYNDICSKFFANEKNYKIESSNTGFETLIKYSKTTPDILILNPNFDDINYIDIIDRLSICPNEKNKCNTIRDFDTSRPILKLFNSYRNITPKYFLETISTYLHVKKSKK